MKILNIILFKENITEMFDIRSLSYNNSINPTTVLFTKF